MLKIESYGDCDIAIYRPYRPRSNNKRIIPIYAISTTWIIVWRHERTKIANTTNPKKAPPYPMYACTYYSRLAKRQTLHFLVQLSNLA